MLFELIPVGDNECVPIFGVDGDLLHGGAEVICVAREKSLHTVETLGFHIKVRLRAVPAYVVGRHEPRAFLDEEFTFIDEDVRWQSAIEASEDTYEWESQHIIRMGHIERTIVRAYRQID